MEKDNLDFPIFKILKRFLQPEYIREMNMLLTKYSYFKTYKTQYILQNKNTNPYYVSSYLSVYEFSCEKHIDSYTWQHLRGQSNTEISQDSSIIQQLANTHARKDLSEYLYPIKVHCHTPRLIKQVLTKLNNADFVRSLFVWRWRTAVWKRSLIQIKC